MGALADTHEWWVGRNVDILVHIHCYDILRIRICFHTPSMENAMKSSQLLAMDVSVRATMKGAAKCDKHCDLQNSVNQQIPERILRFRDTPESMPASVSTFVSCRCSASP